MKVTLDIPDQLAAIFSALAEAAGRPIETIILDTLSASEDWKERHEFVFQAETFLDAGADVVDFVRRASSALEHLTGSPLSAAECDHLHARLAFRN